MRGRSEKSRREGERNKREGERSKRDGERSGREGKRSGRESLKPHHTLSSWVASDNTRWVDRTVFSSGKRLKREGSKV